MESNGIKHTVNIPYTPEKNGVAERESRIILEAARSMIHSNPNLPSFLWAEAMNTAVYVINRTGGSRIGNKTPHELWYGNESSIDNLKIFGCRISGHLCVRL